jgi:CheY-like chemotaxis protein
MPGDSVILFVDDSVADTELFEQHFETFAGVYNLQVVHTGGAAKAYLQGTGKYRNREKYPTPTTILLDLKMPGLDGFELLEWIRKQPYLKEVRVAVLTEPTEIRQVTRAYQMGANSFLMKPPQFEELRDLLLALQAPRSEPTQLTSAGEVARSVRG